MADPLKTAVDSIIAHFNEWNRTNPENEKIPIFILTIGVGEQRSGGYNYESTNYDALNNALALLSINTEVGTRTETFIDREEQSRNRYTSLYTHPYVFMLSLDDATKPNLMNVKSKPIDGRDAVNLFDKYDDVLKLYKKMGRDGEVMRWGVSAKIPRLSSDVPEIDIWTKIRKDGDFKSMIGIREENQMTALQPVFKKIVERKGVILLHNDAWWENNPGPSQIAGRLMRYYAGPYLQNAYMESYPWVGNMLWSLPDLKNVWFLARIGDRETRRSGLMRWEKGLRDITALPYKDDYGIRKPAKRKMDIVAGFVPYGPKIKKSPFNELVYDPLQPFELPRSQGGKRTLRTTRKHRRRSYRQRKH